MDESTTSSESEIENQISNMSKVLTTPAVRRLAIEHNIKLKDVVGTGKEGRILKEDVLNYIENLNNQKSVSANADQSENIPKQFVGSQRNPKESPIISTPRKMAAKPSSDRIEPIKGIKKAMAKTMTQALNVPHFGLSEEIDMTHLVQFRPTMKKLAEERSIQLSFMPFFVKAASLALTQFPIINSSVDEKCENMTIKGSHNIGVAMDTKQGLLVPNIKNVENLTVLEIALELNRLQELGSKGQLSTHDLTNGTFTLSNIGSVCLQIIFLLFSNFWL